MSLLDSKTYACQLPRLQALIMTMFMAVKRRYPAPYKVSATHGANSRRYGVLKSPIPDEPPR